MNPAMTWISEHLGLVLVAGLALGVAAAVLGLVGAWRSARRLARAPRPLARLAGSLLLAGAGAFALFFFGPGAVKLGPGLEARNAMLGQPAPAVRFAHVDSNQPGELSDFEDQVVLLNVWATWCPPCRHEMPALDRLQREYRDRGLVVLHISDEARETIAAWLAERSFETVHGYLPSLPWPDMGRPATFVIDRDGVVRRVILGARSYEQFEDEISRYL